MRDFVQEMEDARNKGYFALVLNLGHCLLLAVYTVPAESPLLSGDNATRSRASVRIMRRVEKEFRKGETEVQEED